MMRKLFIKHPCELCGKPISNAGFASFNHMKMHQREGLMDKHFALTEEGRKARVAIKEKSCKTK